MSRARRRCREGFGALGLVAASFSTLACSEPTPASVTSEPVAPRGAGCRDGDPERERYGTDCSCCHQDQFAASGSIAASAQSSVSFVEVVDAMGQRLEMRPNPYGNFFRHRPRPEPPLSVRVVFVDGGARAMKALAPHGACNACHGDGQDAPLVGAAGPASDFSGGDGGPDAR